MFKMETSEHIDFDLREEAEHNTTLKVKMKRRREILLKSNRSSCAIFVTTHLILKLIFKPIMIQYIKQFYGKLNQVRHSSGDVTAHEKSVHLIQKFPLSLWIKQHSGEISQDINSQNMKELNILVQSVTNCYLHSTYKD